MHFSFFPALIAAPLTIKTLDGQVYTEVEIRSADATGLSILHSDGTAKILAANLTPEQRATFGIDKLAETALKAQQAQTEARREALNKELGIIKLLKPEEYAAELSKHVEAYNTTATYYNTKLLEAANSTDGLRDIRISAIKIEALKDKKLQLKETLFQQYGELIAIQSPDEATKVRQAIRDDFHYLGMPPWAFQVLYGMPESTTRTTQVGIESEVWLYRDFKGSLSMRCEFINKKLSSVTSY